MLEGTMTMQMQVGGLLRGVCSAGEPRKRSVKGPNLGQEDTEEKTSVGRDTVGQFTAIFLIPEVQDGPPW